MNTLDFLLLVPLLWGLYKGFRKGLIFELTTFVALFAGVYGALHFSGIAEAYLVAALGEEPDHLPLIAFGTTFLFILVAVHLIGRALSKMVRWVALGLLDRLLGGLFGFLKMALFMLVILVLVRSFYPGKGEIVPKAMQEDSLILSEMDRITKEVMRYDLGEEWDSLMDQEAES